MAAQLAFVGADFLLCVDTLAPANGFTPTQLQSFGHYFDQTLFPIDTAAFGAPSDVDANGRVIVLMSPVVNAVPRLVAELRPEHAARFLPVRTTPRHGERDVARRLAAWLLLAWWCLAADAVARRPHGQWVLPAARAGSLGRRRRHRAATGQSFPVLFADFGLALYTDSLPGLPRATAPDRNRFTSRNVKQLWARLFATSGPTSDIPVAQPVQLFPITSDTSSAVMNPGTMTYFRIDTPSGSPTVTIRFAGPSGAPLAAALKPQIAIFRLPAGQ